MNLIKILTYLGGTILIITLTLSYFYISVVTNFIFNYGNIYSAFNSQITAGNFQQHAKVKRKVKRLKQVEDNFQVGADLVRNICDQYGGHLKKPPGIKNIIWSIAPQHSLLMCRTAKHGSTTWANIFVQILSRKYDTNHFIL